MTTDRFPEPRRFELNSSPRRITLVDRIDHRLAGIMNIREQWPNQWFNGTLEADPSVVVEFSFAGWDQGATCLMGTPITYIGMFRGCQDLVEFSLGATPVKPTLEVARDYLLPVVNALMGYKAKPCIRAAQYVATRNAC